MLRRRHISSCTANDRVKKIFLLLFRLIELWDSLNFGKIHMPFGALTIKIDKFTSRRYKQRRWVFIKTWLSGVHILLSSWSRPHLFTSALIVMKAYLIILFFKFSASSVIRTIVKDIHSWVAMHNLGNCHLTDIFGMSEERFSRCRF